MYYLGFTYADAFNLPIWKRRWFLDRVVREISESNTTKDAANDPMHSALAGSHRQDRAPSRLRRFT